MPGTIMSNANQHIQQQRTTDARLKQVALRMARRCRHIIQGCLREEEWRDADTEFYAIILEELQNLASERLP
jgi:hypothetical protein